MFGIELPDRGVLRMVDDLLPAPGAHDTYLRIYRGVLDAAWVVEFMLLERLFPRSIFYSLKLDEHNLDKLLRNPQS